jgi:hypothetical protein
MSNSPLPQWAIDRVLKKRGRLHIHEDIDPRRTALLVVDVQNAFLVEEDAVSFVPDGTRIIPNVNALAAAVRGTGGKVFWIKNTADRDDLRSWSNWFAMMPAGFAELYLRTMAPGAPGHDLFSGLVIEPEDETVHKRRFSGAPERLVGSSRAPGTPRYRYDPRRRRRDEQLLRMHRARRGHAQLPDDHGQRCECRKDQWRTPRDLGHVLRELR